MKQPNGPVTRATYVPGNKSYPLSVRKLVAQNVISGAWSPNDCVAKTGCSLSAVKKWKKQHLNGKFMYEHSHRPSLINAEQSRKIKDLVAEKSKTGILISKQKFGKILQEAVNITSSEENKLPQNVTPRFGRDFLKGGDIQGANAEVIDNPHLVALNDPRHAASHAAMMHYLHKTVPRGLYFNMDKTSFDMRKEEQENTPALYVGKRPQTVKCDDPYSNGPRGNCSVHLFVVANDGGKVADMVYVVKDKHMPADTIDAYEAPMLDGTTSVGASAWLLFVGDSSPNKDEALQWVFSKIVVPFIAQVRSRSKNDCSTPTSLCVDGDPRQLQIIASESIQAAFLGANIIASKSPASCTPIFQPLDVGNLFKAAKTRFRTLLDEGYEPDNSEDKTDLQEIFRKHRIKHPQSYKKNKLPSVAMGRYFTDVMKCLHTAGQALRDTLKPGTVKKSFRSAGVSPTDPSAIRQKCLYPWSSDEKRQFVEAIPVLSDIIARNFELKEIDFDDAHIPANNESRDTLSVHRRRSLLLHAPHVVADLQEQVAKRAKK